VQLPGLTSLIVDLHDQGEEPWSGHDIAWRALALLPNLSSLIMKFRMDAGWLYLNDLTALQPLGGKLQHLDISCGALQPSEHQSCDFLSSFTGGWAKAN
jgi:hypothetical protein